MMTLHSSLLVALGFAAVGATGCIQSECDPHVFKEQNAPLPQYASQVDACIEHGTCAPLCEQLFQLDPAAIDSCKIEYADTDHAVVRVVVSDESRCEGGDDIYVGWDDVDDGDDYGYGWDDGGDGTCDGDSCTSGDDGDGGSDGTTSGDNGDDGDDGDSGDDGGGDDDGGGGDDGDRAPVHSHHTLNDPAQQVRYSLAPQK